MRRGVMLRQYDPMVMDMRAADMWAEAMRLVDMLAAATRRAEDSPSEAEEGGKRAGRKAFRTLGPEWSCGIADPLRLFCRSRRGADAC